MRSKIEKLREDYNCNLNNIDKYDNLCGDRQSQNYIKYLENKIIKNDEINFKRFMRLQIDEIEKYKWCKSEEAGYDLGNACCQEWVEKFAKSFAKKYWNE